MPSKSRGLLFTAIILGLLLLASASFAYWAYNGRQDYKNNSDKKSAIAVEAAKKVQAAELQVQFDEQSKSPFKVFHGSPVYGTISFNYPKTWSAYVDETNPSEPINAYFYPLQVPGIQSKTAFALRIELLNTDYTQILQQFTSLITQKTITARAYVPPKLTKVNNITAGTYFSGQINQQDQTQRGYMVVIKVRDKTLEISTQSSDFLSDFNNTILASLTFAP